jgi:hypothetical protein
VTQRVFQSGVVVLDANVLLALYEVGSTARDEVFSILEVMANRIWIPHQVALEFSRNRKRVVVDRLSRFRSVRKTVKSAATDAIDVLESAVDQVLKLRDRNRTSRPWSLAEIGLDRESLEGRLTNVMQPALIEIDALEAEHDIHPSALDQTDDVFDRIDALLVGRIGRSFSRSKMRSIVEEAVDFRYPNKIPPGYHDSGKPRPVDAAGDYILWRQVLDHALTASRAAGILLVTSDAKPDWWLISDKGKVVGPHPELVQEMRDEAGKDFVMTSLSDFLDGAATYLSATISSETVAQVRAAEVEAASVYSHAALGQTSVDLFRLRIDEFEMLVRELFLAMGYSEIQIPDSRRMDLVLRDENALVPATIIVEIKRYIKPMSTSVVREVVGLVHEVRADAAIIVTSGGVTEQAAALAKQNSVRLINGKELGRLLREHLGVHVVPAEDMSNSEKGE